MAVQIEVVVPIAPDEAFRAWTAPEAITRWWGDDSAYRAVSWVSDLRCGGLWRAGFQTADGSQFGAGGAYLEITRPQRLAFTWCADWAPDRIKQITIEIDPHEEGSVLVVASNGDETDVERSADERAWTQIAGWLARGCLTLR